MAEKILIRYATKYDLIPLEVLLGKGIEESGGLLPNYDALHTYHAAINQIAAGLIFVAAAVDEAAKREKIVGCLVLDTNTWHWNPSVTILRSVHFYVVPEARGQRLADGKTPVWKGLLDAAQELADGNGLPLIVEVMHKLDDD